MGIRSVRPHAETLVLRAYYMLPHPQHPLSGTESATRRCQARCHGVSVSANGSMWCCVSFSA